MKNQQTKLKTMAAWMLCIFGLLIAVPANAQNGDGVWHKTIIVTTLDGTTLEYLIDENTKVRIEKPNLVIETEGVTLHHELEQMGQLRYGKRFITERIQEIAGNKSFSFDNETLFFDQLPENSLIEVFTTDGKKTYSRSCSGDTQVSLLTLSPGAYIVKVNSNTYKILKK